MRSDPTTAEREWYFFVSLIAIGAVSKAFNDGLIPELLAEKVVLAITPVAAVPLIEGALRYFKMFPSKDQTFKREVLRGFVAIIAAGGTVLHPPAAILLIGLLGISTVGVQAWEAESWGTKILQTLLFVAALLALFAIVLLWSAYTL